MSHKSSSYQLSSFRHSQRSTTIQSLIAVFLSLQLVWCCCRRRNKTLSAYDNLSHLDDIPLYTTHSRFEGANGSPYVSKSHLNQSLSKTSTPRHRDILMNPRVKRSSLEHRVQCSFSTSISCGQVLCQIPFLTSVPHLTGPLEWSVTPLWLVFFSGVKVDFSVPTFQHGAIHSLSLVEKRESSGPTGLTTAAHSSQRG